MTLPAQFKKENSENIFIYHYVEEMIADYTKYVKEILDDPDITVAELPFLIRIRFSEKTTQKELVEGYLFRCEDPTNRRKKIVELTSQGIEKTDKLIELINCWEMKVTKNMSDEEVKTLKYLLFKVVEP